MTSVVHANIQSVSLAQKIGQMIMVGFDKTSLSPTDPIAQDIINQRVGGVILFDDNYQLGNNISNIENPQQLSKLTAQLQHFAKEATSHNQTAVMPLLIAIDYEGGERATRLKPQRGFPVTVNAGYLGTQPIEVAQRYATLMANTLSAAGINLVLGPVLDVNVNPDSPAIGKLGRSFSSDPQKVIQYAKIFSDTYAKHSILCSYKHFPGHGSANGDTHTGFVDTTNTWSTKELIPYEYFLNYKNGCDLVMIAHIINKHLDTTGYPSTLSTAIINNLLHNKMHFKGVVITDDLQMGKILSNYGLENTVKLSILAGADILLFANQLKYQPDIATEVIKIVTRMVDDGVISQDRIDESYRKILTLKRKLAVMQL